MMMDKANSLIYLALFNSFKFTSWELITSRKNNSHRWWHSADDRRPHQSSRIFSFFQSQQLFSIHPAYFLMALTRLICISYFLSSALLFSEPNCGFPELMLIDQRKLSTEPIREIVQLPSRHTMIICKCDYLKEKLLEIGNYLVREIEMHCYCAISLIRVGLTSNSRNFIESNLLLFLFFGQCNTRQVFSFHLNMPSTDHARPRFLNVFSETLQFHLMWTFSHSAQEVLKPTIWNGEQVDSKTRKRFPSRHACEMYVCDKRRKKPRENCWKKK